MCSITISIIDCDKCLQKKNINVEFGGAIIISYVHSLWQDGHFNGVYMLKLHTNSLYRRMRDMGKKARDMELFLSVWKCANRSLHCHTRQSGKRIPIIIYLRDIYSEVNIMYICWFNLERLHLWRCYFTFIGA